jgi:hypothetical protein
MRLLGRRKQKNSDHSQMREAECGVTLREYTAEAGHYRSSVSGVAANSVQTFVAALFALHFLRVTLNCRGSFTLALGSWLLVKLTATNFGHNAGFFAGTLETTQGYVEGFILFNFDGWHRGLTFTIYRCERSPSCKLWKTRFLRVADVNPLAAEMQNF